MTVRYEWDVETMDEHGDVVDHDHEETVEELFSRSWPLNRFQRLVLVRDEWNDDQELKDRTWAYCPFLNGEHSWGLPMYFQNNKGVPKRFHDELEKAVDIQG